ncbi:hypothetical protein ACM614_29415 [Streptomyces sp. 12297]
MTVKALRDGVESSQDRGRFRREAAIGARLRHPPAGTEGPNQTNRDLLVLERRGGGDTMVAFPGHPAKVGSDESAPRSEAIVGHGWNVYTFFF